MATSPLDDPNMYLQIAKAAAARGAPGGAMPPQAPTAPPSGGADPQAAIITALQSIQPPLSPPQIQGVIKIIQMILQKEEQGEPPELGGTMPPNGM